MCSSNNRSKIGGAVCHQPGAMHSSKNKSKSLWHHMFRAQKAKRLQALPLQNVSFQGALLNMFSISLTPGGTIDAFLLLLPLLEGQG